MIKEKAQRLLTILIVLGILVVPCIDARATVETDIYVIPYTTTGFEYQIDTETGEASIRNLTTGDNSLVIPSVINHNGVDYTVTTIKDHFAEHNTSIQSIVIPATITSIESEAFGRCHSLTSITFLGTTPPANMGSNVFNECPFTTVNVPAGCAQAYNNSASFSAVLPAAAAVSDGSSNASVNGPALVNIPDPEYITELKDTYDSLKNAIKDLKEGKLQGKQTFYMNKGNALPLGIMKLLSENPNLVIDFKYYYEGQYYHAIIPGDKVIIDESIPWYGPLYLNKYYGVKD